MSIGLGLGFEGLVFGASVESRFGSEKSKLERNYFYTITDWTRVWEVYINPVKAKNLRPYLNEDAKKAIDTWNPDELFEIFGTHFVTAGYFGGAMEFNLSESFTSASEAKSIEVAVQAQYQSVSASSDFNIDNNQLNENFKSNVKIYARGGDVQYANKSSAGDNSQYNMWVNSIPTKAVLIDFREGSLVPIWELAETQERKNVLKAAFNRLLAQHPLPEGNAASIMMMNEHFYVKSKSNDQYWDFNGYHFGANTQKGILGLAPKDVNSGGWQGGDRFFKIIPHATESEYVFFQPQHASEVLDVQNGSKSEGTSLWLWPKGESNIAQMFKMTEVDGEPNTFYIESKNSGLYFTEKDGKIVLESKTKQDNQKWIFESASVNEMAPPPLSNLYTKYIITLHSSGLLWDVDNAGGSGSRIKLNHANGNMAQVFSLEQLSENSGFFLVPRHNWGLNLDLHNKHGDDFRAWERNNSASQFFVFEWAGEPRVYKIRLKEGTSYITADKGYKNSDGCRLFSAAPGSPEVQNWKMNLSNKIALRNKYLANTVLHTFSPDAVYSTQVDANNSKAQWYIEPGPDGFVFLKNAADGTLLNIENGKLASTDIGREAHSAQWKIEVVPGDEKYVRIKNRWKGTFLNTEGGNMNCSNIQDGWDSARWEMFFKL